jgi:hypothetical protein
MNWGGKSAPPIKGGVPGWAGLPGEPEEARCLSWGHRLCWEADHKTVCSACKACGGTSAKAKVDMVIIGHGTASRANAFNRRNAA